MLNGFLTNLSTELPSLLLSLPIILFSLAFHELSHGYAALKLGDPTARNLGRLTLNPMRHIDPIGFLCMVLFHFGWANPVPINTRNFKNPRRDMALSSAAGPLSNMLLAVIFAALLRLTLLLVTGFLSQDVDAVYAFFHTGSYTVSRTFVILAIISFMLYLGVTINFSYALFNLLPVPPLDGSRIFYIFLPTKWYFGIMKYERIIMFVMLALLWTGLLITPLSFAAGTLSNWTFSLFGVRSGQTGHALNAILYYIATAISM